VIITLLVLAWLLNVWFVLLFFKWARDEECIDDKMFIDMTIDRFEGEFQNDAR